MYLLVPLTRSIFYASLLGLMFSVPYFGILTRFPKLEQYLNSKRSGLWKYHGMCAMPALFLLQPDTLEIIGRGVLNLYISSRGNSFDYFENVTENFTTTTAESNLHSVAFTIASSFNVFQYLLATALAWLLWDLGCETCVNELRKGKLRNYVLVQFHHVALFIPFLATGLWCDYGVRAEQIVPSESLDQQTRLQLQIRNSQNWHSTTVLGWFWFCHAFGMIRSTIFPCLGQVFRVVLTPILGQRYADMVGKFIWNDSEKRLRSFEIFKHFYSVVLVYLQYLYLNQDNNDSGNNFTFYSCQISYQTLVLLVFFTGRWSVNNNFIHVNFIRRIEVPGGLVLLTHQFLKYKYGPESGMLTTAFCVVFTVYIGVVLPIVLFTGRTHLGPKPKVWVAPGLPDAGKDTEDELRRFLDRCHERHGSRESGAWDRDLTECTMQNKSWAPDKILSQPWVKQLPESFQLLLKNDYEGLEGLLKQAREKDLAALNSAGDKSDPKCQANNVDALCHAPGVIGSSDHGFLHCWAYRHARWGILLLLLDYGADPFRTYNSKRFSLASLIYTAAKFRELGEHKKRVAGVNDGEYDVGSEKWVSKLKEIALARAQTKNGGAGVVDGPTSKQAAIKEKFLMMINKI